MSQVSSRILSYPSSHIREAPITLRQILNCHSKQKNETIHYLGQFINQLHFGCTRKHRLEYLKCFRFAMFLGVFAEIINLVAGLQDT